MTNSPNTETGRSSAKSGPIRRPFISPAVVLIFASAASATLGPPVKISMPDATQPAAAGREYGGEFEIVAGHEGRLTSFALSGKGWDVLSFDALDGTVIKPGEALRVSFRAIPSDVKAPLNFSVAFDGRRAARSFTLSPEEFARRGKARPLVKVGPAMPAVGPAGAPPRAGPSRGGAPEGGDPEGGCEDQLIHFTGRLVYLRPATTADFNADNGQITGNTIEVGVDGIRVEIRDDDGLDPLGDDVMWTGLTDANGFFEDTICWSDGDIFESGGPDIYIYFEADTDVVNVEDTVFVTDVDYSWSSEDAPGDLIGAGGILDNFTDSELEFGTLRPADLNEMGALHIFNSIVRAHRLIQDVSGVNVDDVTAQWPEGTNAQYISVFEQIDVGITRTWDEGSHTHEYGHHFLDNYVDSNIPGYCNGFTCGCGGPPGGCPDDGHCNWCPENSEDAWAEGWPDWLADVVTRSYSQEYLYWDATGNPVVYAPLMPRSNEVNSGTCCGQTWGPVITEGFVGALVRDIEDAGEFADDPVTGLPDPDPDGDGIPNPITQPACARDALALGADEVFDVLLQDHPDTVLVFLNAFRSRYPQHSTGLWKTASSIGGAAYTWPDSSPPGVVTALDSPTHALGGSGTFPLITVTWQEAPDDASGADIYEVGWSSTPLGQPFFTQTTSGPVGGVFSAVSPPLNLGEYWLSIRAQDCAGNWSEQIAFFGPFVVDECNGNGIVDVCETACDLCAALPPGQPCPPEIQSFCSISGCGTASDCNANRAPDACDVGSGQSRDCNANESPDECEAVTYVAWAGCVDCGCPPANPNCTPVVDCTWDGVNCWSGFAHAWMPAPPGTGDRVCIEDIPNAALIEHSTGTTSVLSIGCYEDFKLSNGTLSTSEKSAFHGSFFHANGTFTGPADVDLHGPVTWSSGTLSGSGTTTVLPGASLTLSGGSKTLSRILRNDSPAANWTGGLFNFLNGTLNNFGVFTAGCDAPPPDCPVNPDLILAANQGGTNRLNNFGLFRKIGSGTLTVNNPIAFTNSGIVDVVAGILVIELGGVGIENSSTGAFNGAPGATLRFGGPHNLSSSSSIDAVTVEFSGGPVNIDGNYHADGSTTVSGGTINFNPAATLVSVGSPLTISGGTANFSSGEPVNAVTLVQSGGGVLTGSSNLVVTGSLTWSSGVMSGTGATQVLPGADFIMSASSKTLSRLLTNSSSTASWTGGTLNFLNGTLMNLGSFTGGATADISMVANQGGANAVHNAGTFSKTGSGMLTVHNPIAFDNDGTVLILDGTLRFTGPCVQTGGTTILNGGTLQKTGTPVALAGGSLTGNGTVIGSVSNTGGQLVPGLSAGNLTVTGVYTQGAGGSLDIELGGLASGSEYDVFHVSGAASLAGALDVSLINGFAPAPTNVFTILTAGSINGSFSNCPNNGGGTGLLSISTGAMTVAYTTTSVVLSSFVPGPVVLGDMNCDGVLDLQDVSPFALALANPAGYAAAFPNCNILRGDMNLDVAVDGADVQLFVNTILAP